MFKTQLFHFSFKLLQPFCSSAGLDNHKCHACHAKHRWMSPSARLATQSASGCRQVPRLPRQTKVDVAKCHACRAKCCAECHMRHACHTKRRRMSPSARPATQSAGGCRQAPHLPRKVPQRPQPHHQIQPSAISATPATQNIGGCRQAPGLPRKVQVDVAKCDACHARCRGARATWSAPPGAAQCHKRHACHANIGGSRQATRFPRKCNVDVAKCHACDATARQRATMP